MAVATQEKMPSLKKWENNFLQKGVSTLEILIAVVIIVFVLVNLLGAASFALQISSLNKETTQANSLAQEAMEGARNFRDGTSWDTDGLGILTSGVSYYLKLTNDNPPAWQLVQGEEVLGKFNRTIIFSDVSRDLNDNIVESGGVNDPETKKLTVTISWRDKSIQISTYLTNWQGKDS